MKRSNNRRNAARKRIPASEQLRRTMRQWASGVVVVSSRHRNEESGMTVSAFASATIEPPTVIVCLNKTASTLKPVRLSKKLAISVLSEKQMEISRVFAGMYPQIKGSDRFRGLRTFTATTGSPILRGSVGWLDCTVSRLVKLSSHYLVICTVVAAGENPRAGKPLLYHDREYRTLSA